MNPTAADPAPSAALPATPVTSIWVDADACPGVIKDILYRAAMRVKMPTTFVANRFLSLPGSPYLRALQVPQGIDVADNEIVGRVQPGDLVITADIPLAAAVIAKQAVALNPRGELYTRHNIGEHLARRNLLDELRSTGQITGGPPPFSSSDQKAFARELDRYLARSTRPASVLRP